MTEYVYVASSWRNSTQPHVVKAIRGTGIECYDFRNPAEGSVGFSWRETKSEGGSVSKSVCENCERSITLSSYSGMGFWEPDIDLSNDPVVWRHDASGYAACDPLGGSFAMPKKGADLEPVGEYLRMLSHPRAIEGFAADFAAMQRADAFILVLPCGKSAHLELGWAVGAGKRTAILLEDPVEPELMYSMVDLLTTSLEALVGWLVRGEEKV